MNCRRARQYLYAYCKHELSPDEAKEVKSHLDICNDCTRAMEDIVETNLMFKNGLEVFSPSPEFNGKLLAKLQELPSPVERRVRRTWWQDLLHETFPSIRLRWVASGAVAVIIVALVTTMVTQRHISKDLGTLALDSTGTDHRTLAVSGGKADTSLDRLFEEVKANIGVTNKAFVIDNLTTPAFGRESDLTSQGEDGRITPVDLRRRFMLEKSSYQDAKRGSNYVLPVVSTQPVSQRADF